MSHAPIAVLGVGGIGGMLAARTGALCVGTERSVDAIRAGGLKLVEGATTTVARPEAVDAARASGLAARRRGQGPRPRRRARPGRAGGARGAVVVPLLNGLEHVERIRAHFDARRSEHERCLSSPREASGASRRTRRSPASSSSGRPGRRGSAAASDELGDDAPRARARAAPRPGPRGRRCGRRARRAVGEGRAARGGRGRDRRLGSDGRGGARRSDVERAASRRHSGRRARSQRADGVSLDPAGQWEIIEALPGDLTPSTARDARAGRPTELDAITGSVVRAGGRAGVPTPRSRSSSRRPSDRSWSRDDGSRAGRHAAPSGAVEPTGEAETRRPARRAGGRRDSRRLRRRRRSALAPALRVVRLGLRPRDLLAVRLAARAPRRAVQHDQPEDAARRPRRAGNRRARAARGAGDRGAGNPRRAGARPRCHGAPPLPARP